MNYFLIILIALAVGCEQKPKARHYTEEIINAAPVSASAPQGHLTWEVPATWVEEPASQMRLATFKLNSDPQAIDVSIVSLPGGAGGLEANLRRWMDQINVQVSDSDFATFIDASKDRIFDFTKIQKGADRSTKSMIAAMLEVEGETVFVKMTGSIAAVGKHKPEFLELAKSVRSR